MIGKICSLVYYKSYFRGLVHDFVICFFFSYISCPRVIVVIIRINAFILFYSWPQIKAGDADAYRKVQISWLSVKILTICRVEV